MDHTGEEKQERKAKRVSGGMEAEKYIRHSSGYHDYFAGWTEKKVEKADGGYTIQRVYTFDYFQLEGSRGRFFFVKLSYVLLCGLGLALFLLAFGQDSEMASFLPVTVLGALAPLPLLYLLYNFINIMVTPRKMTVGQYRVMRKFRMTALVVSILLTIMLIASLIYYVTRPDSRDLNRLLLQGGAALSFWGLYLFEKHLKYLTIENPNKTEKGTNEIW